jgi:hypothetical protein
MATKIIQTDPPVPTEIIASSIVEISQGVKRLLGGKLNERAAVLLIQHACPAGAISGRDVKLVLQGIKDLEAQYIKKT